jgi:hypothetical protein
MHPVFKEPLLRIVTAAFVKRFCKSLEMQEQWDSHERPQYLTGILWGATQARIEGLDKICAIEFGVASGKGLLAMQSAAHAVEDETGISVEVYGFDMGSGLTPPSAGYRDHPDKWQQGDYPMLNIEGLESQLSPKTHLILGNVEETVVNFVNNVQEHPVGFVSFDLDYYSSTIHALKVFTLQNRKALIHTPAYFDDTLFFGMSDYTGERLAIREFNDSNQAMKIDAWECLRYGRPFHERSWLKGMYVINDFSKMESVHSQERAARVL